MLFMWAYLLWPAGSIRIICATRAYQCTNAHSARGAQYPMIEACAERTLIRFISPRAGDYKIPFRGSF